MQNEKLSLVEGRLAGKNARGCQVEPGKHGQQQRRPTEDE